MNKLIHSSIKKIETIYNIKPSTIKLIVIFPFITVSFIILILALPVTRTFGVRLLKENNLIELLTFLFLLLGGIKGLTLVKEYKNSLLSKYEAIFYTIFSIGLLFVAMEEISWGQWFLGFETPDFWKEINIQGETTLHNLKGIQGNSEILRFIFGFGGTIGVLLSNKRSLKKIGAPTILLPYFIITIFFSGLDFFSNYYAIHKYIDYGVKGMSEVLEMFIGISGFLYVWLNFKKLKILLK